MKKSNFALRLQPSLMEEAKKVAKAEGVAVNQLINVAVAEKVSALRTEEYFAERARKGDIKKALQVLKRAHIVKSVRKLDDENADILRCGDKKFSQAFNMSFSAAIFYFSKFCDAVH